MSKLASNALQSLENYLENADGLAIPLKVYLEH